MLEVKRKSQEQECAEADVQTHRQELGPFVVAAETTRMAMVFTDAKVENNPVVFANDSFLSLSGFERAELLGQPFRSLMAAGSDPDSIAQMGAAFKGITEPDPEIQCRRKGGSVFCASIFVNPLHNQSGELEQHFVSFVDLTTHKQAQAHSRMLIDELNHRVKNMLATVQSIVWQAFRKSSDKRVIGESIQVRLSALSRSHDLLTRENYSSAGLRDILIDALEPFGVSGAQAKRLVVIGENVRLSPRVTLALAIAFNELATNAVEYGAFSNEAGSIEITWTVTPSSDGDQLILNWTEKGGPTMSAPTRKGFGLQVIERGLPQELQARYALNSRPPGSSSRCSFSSSWIPVTRSAMSSRRILVVEDDMLIRLTLEDMLSELGCASVRTAGTVDQALGLLDTHVFDAATLDVNLAGKSSYPVADALAARGVPFAFSTGYDVRSLRDGYRERPILKKPFGHEDLADALARLLP